MPKVVKQMKPQTRTRAGTTGAFCPRFHKAVETVGRRWTGTVIRSLLGGARRFSEIGAAIPGISGRLLAERLRELEQEGLITREVGAGPPVRVTYTLTRKGRDLDGAIGAISAWAERWLPLAASEPHPRQRRA